MTFGKRLAKANEIAKKRAERIRTEHNRPLFTPNSCSTCRGTRPVRRTGRIGTWKDWLSSPGCSVIGTGRAVARHVRRQRQQVNTNRRVSTSEGGRKPSNLNRPCHL
jgi:hypothetical protein